MFRLACKHLLVITIRLSAAEANVILQVFDFKSRKYKLELMKEHLEKSHQKVSRQSIKLFQPEPVWGLPTHIVIPAEPCC